MPPSRPTVRAAAPLPPVTCTARPVLVLTSLGRLAGLDGVQKPAHVHRLHGDHRHRAQEGNDVAARCDCDR